MYSVRAEIDSDRKYYSSGEKHWGRVRPDGGGKKGGSCKNEKGISQIDICDEVLVDFSHFTALTLTI